MAETIKVERTPVQRNSLDVAVELTQLYYKQKTPSSLEELKATFTELYKTVREAYCTY